MPYLYMSETEQKIYDYTKEYILEHCYPPTVREISEHIQRSTSVTHGHLREMAENGIISFKENSPRTLQIPNLKVIEV